MKNSSMLLFFNFLVIGLIFSISSCNWIMMWCGLEISLVCFMPLMLNNKFISSECCIKYFIIQSLSSCIFVLSIVMFYMNENFDSNMIIISLMMKMGVSPFHTWVLNVIEGLLFNSSFLLLTLLKLPPLCILSYLISDFSFFIILSLMMGSLFGLNQNSCLKIIVYSSIFNLGFMLSSLFFNYIWLTYYLFYCLLLSMFMFMLSMMNVFYVNQFFLNNNSFFVNFVVLINLLSMGGMPPMMGFMIKLIVLELMLNYHFYFTSFIMIIFSLFVMYFYIRVTFLCLMIYISMFKYNLYNFKVNSIMFLFINLFSLPFILFFKFYM